MIIPVVVVVIQKILLHSSEVSWEFGMHRGMQCTVKKAVGLFACVKFFRSHCCKISFICLHCTVVYTLSICLRYKRLIQHQYPAINQIQNLKNIDQLLAVRSVKTSN